MLKVVAVVTLENKRRTTEINKDIESAVDLYKESTKVLRPKIVVVLCIFASIDWFGKYSIGVN